MGDTGKPSDVADPTASPGPAAKSAALPAEVLADLEGLIQAIHEVGVEPAAVSENEHPPRANPASTKASRAKKPERAPAKKPTTEKLASETPEPAKAPAKKPETKASQAKKPEPAKAPAKKPETKASQAKKPEPAKAPSRTNRDLSTTQSSQTAFSSKAFEVPAEAVNYFDDVVEADDVDDFDDVDDVDDFDVADDVDDFDVADDFDDFDDADVADVADDFDDADELDDDFNDADSGADGADSGAHKTAHADNGGVARDPAAIEPSSKQDNRDPASWLLLNWPFVLAGIFIAIGVLLIVSVLGS